MWELIANGTGSDVNSLPSYESEVAEGQRARIDFVFVFSVPSFQVDSLRNTLTWAGVTDVQVVGSGNTITIYYRKDPWWLPVILIEVLALAILLVSWRFYKEASQSPTGTIVLLAMAALSFGLAYSLFRREYT